MMEIVFTVLVVALFCGLGVFLAIYAIMNSMEYQSIDARAAFLIVGVFMDVGIYLGALWVDQVSYMLQALMLSKYMYMSVVDYKRTLAHDQ